MSPPCPPPLLIPRQCRCCLMSLSLGASFSTRYCTHNLTPTSLSNYRLLFGVRDRDVVTAAAVPLTEAEVEVPSQVTLPRYRTARHAVSRICSSECLRQINFKICSSAYFYCRGSGDRRHTSYQPAAIHWCIRRTRPLCLRAEDGCANCRGITFGYLDS